MTYIYSIKCVGGCGLHYNVYSWDDDWNKKHQAICPECGGYPGWVLRVEKSDKAIFQYVSGGPILTQEQMDTIAGGLEGK